MQGKALDYGIYQNKWDTDEQFHVPILGKHGVNRQCHFLVRVLGVLSNPLIFRLEDKTLPINIFLTEAFCTDSVLLSVKPPTKQKRISQEFVIKVSKKIRFLKKILNRCYRHFHPCLSTWMCDTNRKYCYPKSFELSWFAEMGKERLMFVSTQNL